MSQDQKHTHNETASSRPPFIVSPVLQTPGGVHYFKEPSAALVVRPQTNLEAVRPFLESFPEEYEFSRYLDDPDDLSDSEASAKFAGQLCYLSLGPKRTKNEKASGYFGNINESGHGCYDAETEVLTRQGWVLFSEVSGKEKFCTLNSSTGEIEYQDSTGIQSYEHTGKMYRVESRGVDLLVTPNHRMYVCSTSTREGRKRDKFEIIKAEDLDTGSHCYVKSGNFNGGVPTTLDHLVGRSHWISNWSGKVYCVEVPNGILYVRRNGKPVWCGNSVYEHPGFSFLFWGVSRSLTHELVRHRAGFGFSQTSQRYVSGGLLRFCMRPEFQGYPELEEDFFSEAEAQYDRYHSTREKWGKILEANLATEDLASLGRSGLRKMKNQVARTFLGNFVEAPIYVTMNARALRHFMNMRGSRFAETEIRALSLKVFKLVLSELPNILQDVSTEDLPDGSRGLHLQFPKV